jgi:hypothetical protein
MGVRSAFFFFSVSVILFLPVGRDTPLESVLTIERMHLENDQF